MRFVIILQFRVYIIPRIPLQNYTKDIIIKRMDVEYHMKELKLTELIEIIQKLKENRKVEINCTPIDIRNRFYNFEMRKSKSARDFCDRYDAILKEDDLCEKEDRISEHEKRATFFMAVKNVYLSIYDANLTIFGSTGKEMSYEDLRNMLR